MLIPQFGLFSRGNDVHAYLEFDAPSQNDAEPLVRALSEHDQEQVIGRTKQTDQELDDPPATSHVARTDQEAFGRVYRRNTSFGAPSEHGTMFVGFAATQSPLETQLRSMAGLSGPRDALTRFARPVTSGYYFVPCVEDLASVAYDVSRWW